MDRQQLDRIYLFQIKRAWILINDQLFSGLLKEPNFQLLSQGTLLGSWQARDRIIGLQREMVTSSPWLEVRETLKHEMAHQYISEVLKVHDESAHGESFRKVCQERNIVHKAQGTIEKDPEVIKLISKINKLLALAESDQVHEAEQAAQRVHQLLLKHHIKLSDVNEFKSTRDQFESMSFMQLGDVKSRHYQYEYSIANLLSEHFFVSAIWPLAFSAKELKEGRVLEICGREEDIEIAAYVYDFIHHHLNMAWQNYQSAAKTKGLKVKGLKKRLSFCLGLVQGFHQKLTEGRQVYENTHGELLHIGQARADQFLSGRYSSIQTRTSKAWSPTQEYHVGFKEGKALHLRRGVHDQAHQGQKPKQLNFFK